MPAGAGLCISPFPVVGTIHRTGPAEPAVRTALGDCLARFRDHQHRLHCAWRPRQLLAFSCGYFMGGLPGALLSTALTGFGALLAICCVRNIGMEWVSKRHGDHVTFIRRLLAEDTWLWICMVRMMPVGSNLATNIAVALAGLSVPAVFWGSLLGYLPQMLLFSFAGAGVALRDEQQIWISLLMLMLSTVLVLYLYHHGFKQRLQEIRGQPHATPAPVKH